MKRIAALLLACVGVVLPYMKAMDVPPVRAEWSATVWGGEDDGVAQTLCCCWDSICEVHVFLGTVGDTSRHFNVDVYEFPNGIVPVASRHDVGAKRDHAWLIASLAQEPGQKFVRGKEYIVRVFRPGSAC